MKLDYKYNSKYSGQYYQGEITYVIEDAGVTFNTYGLLDGGFRKLTVQLTGYFVTIASVAYYQTTTGVYVSFNDDWVNVGYAPIQQQSPKDAQKYVDKVIKANASILENNLFCARFANKLTEEQQLMLFNLQGRLEQRNYKLVNDGMLSNQRTSSPPGYSDLSPYLDRFMQAYANGDAIGLVISTSTLVISAIVIAALATAAYFGYRAMAAEAEKDVKFSDKLTASLVKKLTPEEYDQLLSETRGIVTKAKITSKLGSAFSFVKWGLLAAAGFVVYKHFKKRGE